MDDIDLKTDTSQFDALLAKLPIKVAGKIVKDALQAGGDVIVTAMKALAPERTDEPMPDSTGLPPGILREDLHTQVTLGATQGANVKIGPSEIAGHVTRWQNNGWVLTGHGKGKRGRKAIKSIPGKHFMEAAVDEAGEAAVDAFVAKLAEGLASATDDTEETL
jgi:hypothetical protein